MFLQEIFRILGPVRTKVDQDGPRWTKRLCRKRNAARLASPWRIKRSSGYAAVSFQGRASGNFVERVTSRQASPRCNVASRNGVRALHSGSMLLPSPGTPLLRAGFSKSGFCLRFRLKAGLRTVFIYRSAGRSGRRRCLFRV